MCTEDNLEIPTSGNVTSRVRDDWLVALFMKH